MKSSEYAASDLEKVFIGHPKYSKQWLHARQTKQDPFGQVLQKRKNPMSLLLVGTMAVILMKKSQKYLVKQQYK